MHKNSLHLFAWKVILWNFFKLKIGHSNGNYAYWNLYLFKMKFLEYYYCGAQYSLYNTFNIQSVFYVVF